MNDKPLSQKYRKDVHNMNLPEYGLLQEIAVAECAKRNQPLRPGTLLREIVLQVHKIWKKKGRLPWA